jgi:tRNA pseudouridine55 synthase
MPPSNGVDGIINFHKATGISSARALYRIRGVTGQRKSGHAGTLDPNASGVLILCLGKATKLVELLMDQPKVYRTTARLDVTSSSFDSETELIDVGVATPPDRAAIDQACASFEGIIQQVPPLTSAVKVNGQPAYKRARSNETLELRARPVRIDWIHVHSYNWPTIDFEMCCGRGTYVRSLIRDLGEALGVGGTLTSLVRNLVGPFTLDDAWSHAQIEDGRESMAFLTDLEQAREMLSSDTKMIPPRPIARTGESVQPLTGTGD